MPGIVDTKSISDNNINRILEKKRIQLIIKRIFDFTVSSIGIIIISPILLVISILIKLDSKGPILFKQIRVGKNGKPFKIFKFRTMVVDAEKKGMQITVGRDSRITKSGHVLRKTKLDELPQLFNVLAGEMSFVGPRPEVRRYVEMYEENQKSILKVRPGITDLASIKYRNENDLLAKSLDPEATYINEIMPKKIELNIEYLKNMSVLYDIKLIIRTVLVVIK